MEVFFSVLVIIVAIFINYYLEKKGSKNNEKTEKKRFFHKSGKYRKTEYNPIESEYEQRDYKTIRGEVVKSYGEKAIADYLLKRGLKYEYEHCFRRENGGINKPDFYLNDYDVYIEYYGMMEYSAKYRFEMHLKRETFEKGNKKVISIYKKHITNHTLKYGLENGFKKIMGFELPNKKEKEFRLKKIKF